MLARNDVSVKGLETISEFNYLNGYRSKFSVSA
jgi:hypothetical protein